MSVFVLALAAWVHNIWVEDVGIILSTFAASFDSLCTIIMHQPNHHNFTSTSISHLCLSMHLFTFHIIKGLGAHGRTFGGAARRLYFGPRAVLHQLGLSGEVGRLEPLEAHSSPWLSQRLLPQVCTRALVFVFSTSVFREGEPPSKKGTQSTRVEAVPDAGCAVMKSEAAVSEAG